MHIRSQKPSCSTSSVLQVAGAAQLDNPIDRGSDMNRFGLGHQTISEVNLNITVLISSTGPCTDVLAAGGGRSSTDVHARATVWLSGNTRAALPCNYILASKYVCKTHRMGTGAPTSGTTGTGCWKLQIAVTGSCTHVPEEKSLK